MASKSRWATADDDAELEAQRKREKEEKKRRKEEKARKAEEEAAAIATTRSPPHNGVEDHDDRPAKRRKTSVEPQATVRQEEGAHLLRIPIRSFGACRDVEQYELLNNIEEGTYGMVSRARSKENGDVVALKRLKLEYSNDGFPVTGLREIQTLKACRHPNVVNLQEVVIGHDLKDVYLVMDFLEHDLKTLLEDMVEPFLPSETKTLMLQIVSATEYLHANWILHRDLKTSNLLLNNRGEIKLADFGMARYTSNPPPKNLTQLVVTLWYRSPELLLGASEYSFEVDIWSLGCIFAELLTREPLFQGKTEVDQLSRIFSLLGTPTKETWPTFRSLPNAKALHPLLSNKTSYATGLPPTHFPYLTASGHTLLNSMLSQNPALRPTASEILKHGYFTQDPRPKAKEMFPTFPSKAGLEKRRRRATPNAPDRGLAPRMGAEDFKGLFAEREEEERGGGFALRMG